MRPTVVFQTDFGAGGGGAMAGVVKSIDPSVNVYDYNHYVEPFNIREAAYNLSSILPFWPAGTIFVSVVDPGVGTSRRSCVAMMKNGSYVVTPDNGILTPMLDDIAAVREIDETVNRLPGTENVHIFHGRDVYAYTAGKLAAGLIDFAGVGPEYPVRSIVLLPMTNIACEVRQGYARGGIYNSEASYGCLRINIPNLEFQRTGGFRYGDIVKVTITRGEDTIFEGDTYYCATFGDAPDAVPLLCGDIQPGERQMLRFTINYRNFIDLYAPELKNNMAAAVDYVFTITKR